MQLRSYNNCKISPSQKSQWYSCSIFLHCAGFQARVGTICADTRLCLCHGRRGIHCMAKATQILNKCCIRGLQKSDTFAAYKKLCCRAFLSLRKHADLIINLFSMVRLIAAACIPMTVAGIQFLPLPPSTHRCVQQESQSSHAWRTLITFALS